MHYKVIVPPFKVVRIPMLVELSGPLVLELTGLVVLPSPTSFLVVLVYWSVELAPLVTVVGMEPLDVLSFVVLGLSVFAVLVPKYMLYES